MNLEYILQIETSTNVCSVAVSSQGLVLAYKELVENNVHASQLTLLIDQLMQQLEISYSDLAAVCVAKGPGSYTGLRIGVSTAKGLCYALGIPLIAINSLKSMAQGYIDENSAVLDASTLICPMIDARRMEVYCAVFDKEMNEIEDTRAVIIEADSFAELTLQYNLHLFGNGADKLTDLFQDTKHIQIAQGFQSSARSMSKLAAESFQNSIFVDLAYFEPYYLKDFVPTSPKLK